MKRKEHKGSQANSANFLVASNPRAARDYDILERLECGIVLTGAEVKSLRARRASIKDAWASVKDGELWLHKMHISPYTQSGLYGAFDPERDRKLLAHRREIDALMGKSEQPAFTLIPTRLYFKDGKAKVEIALARGRRSWDKRAALARAEAQREIERLKKSRLAITGRRGPDSR